MYAPLGCAFAGLLTEERYLSKQQTARKGIRGARSAKQTCTPSYNCENAPADARMLEQRYAMYEPKIIRGGGGDVGGGQDSSVEHHRDSMRVSRFKEAFVAFMKRTSRILVDNPTDGHCGIHCLQEFMRPFSVMPSYLRTISKGRSEMAQALINNHDSLLECSFYSASSEEIYLRSGLHEVAMDGEPCDRISWVETIDLIAWSLEIKKKVCVITDSDLEVMVYSGVAQPECIQLTEFSPSADDVVMFYAGGVHYEALLYFNKDFVKVEDFLDDFHAKNGRCLSEEEHTRFLCRVNAVRNLRSEPLMDLSTLHNALSIWTPRHTEVEQIKTLHCFIDEFYTENLRQPTVEELLPLVNNDLRSKGSHALIGLKSLRNAISAWKRAHPGTEKQKSLHDCIDDMYAEMGRPPTTDELSSRYNEVRGDCTEKTFCQSSLSKSISRWRSAHPEVTKVVTVHLCYIYKENYLSSYPEHKYTYVLDNYLKNFLCIYNISGR